MCFCGLSLENRICYKLKTIQDIGARVRSGCEVRYHTLHGKCKSKQIDLTSGWSGVIKRKGFSGCGCEVRRSLGEPPPAARSGLGEPRELCKRGFVFCKYDNLQNELNTFGAQGSEVTHIYETSLNYFSTSNYLSFLLGAQAIHILK